jgi:hypothetical protein
VRYSQKETTNRQVGCHSNGPILPCESLLSRGIGIFVVIMGRRSFLTREKQVPPVITLPHPVTGQPVGIFFRPGPSNFFGDQRIKLIDRRTGQQKGVVVSTGYGAKFHKWGILKLLRLTWEKGAEVSIFHVPKGKTPKKRVVIMSKKDFDALNKSEPFSDGLFVEHEGNVYFWSRRARGSSKKYERVPGQ